jgi:hypothetical protein
VYEYVNHGRLLRVPGGTLVKVEQRIGACGAVYCFQVGAIVAVGRA